MKPYGVETIATPMPAARPPRPRKGRRAVLHESTIALSTGVTLRYVEQGHPAGIPVVLLHGVTDSWRSFEPALAHLPTSLRTFALSQRGHGDSQRPSSGYRTRDFAADIAAFLDAVGERFANDLTAFVARCA